MYILRDMLFNEFQLNPYFILRLIQGKKYIRG